MNRSMSEMNSEEFKKVSALGPRFDNKIVCEGIYLFHCQVLKEQI